MLSYVTGENLVTWSGMFGAAQSGLFKVVHNNCETIEFMFNGGSCSGSIFCPIDTKI